MMSFTAVNSVPGEIESGLARTALEERFGRLLAENGPALSRLAGSYARKASDRDDLLQDIAMAIWQALPSFRGECTERTFLFRIAHNRAIAYLIRQRSGADEAPEEFEPVDPGPDVETTLVRDEGERRLMRAVRLLPILYRQVVVLMLEGMDYSEIAATVGISESNVGARLTRARQMLRSLLEGEK